MEYKSLPTVLSGPCSQDLLLHYVEVFTDHPVDIAADIIMSGSIEAISHQYLTAGYQMAHTLHLSVAEPAFVMVTESTHLFEGIGY